MEIPPDAPTTFTQRFTRGFVALVIVLVLYVLSIGPAFGFFYFPFLISNPAPSSIDEGKVAEAFDIFYAPVTWTASATGLGPTLTRYCLWWTLIAKRCRGKP